MNLAIWGYGVSGNVCEEIIHKNFSENKVVCYIDKSELFTIA